MKMLSDGTKVLARIYYYLLEFNDSDNFKTIQEVFNKMELHKLNIDEFKTLFHIASERDRNCLLQQLNPESK